MEDKSVGQIIFGSGKIEDFKEPGAFVEAIKREWPYRLWTGFRYETESLIPEVQKAIQAASYHELGIKNPHDLNHYKMLDELTRQSKAQEMKKADTMDKSAEAENPMLQDCYRQALDAKGSLLAKVSAMLGLYELQSFGQLQRDAAVYSPATPLHSWRWQSDEVEAIHTVAERTQDLFYAYKMAEEVTSCGGRAGYLAMGEAGRLLDTLDQPLAPEHSRRIYDAALALCERGHFPDCNVRDHLTPLLEKIKQDCFKERMANAKREAAQQEKASAEPQRRHDERGRE